MPIPQGPDPDTPFPLPEHPRTAYLKNHITRPNIIVGDYTYYDDPAGVANFEANVLYHFDFVGDKLIIGKFCAVATAVKFIMNGANHNISGFSSYPFPIFGHGWEQNLPPGYQFPSRGDTVVGNDVWLGLRQPDHAGRQDRRRGHRGLARRRDQGRAALLHRWRQSGPRHPRPLRRSDHRSLAGNSLVGLGRR